MFFGNFEIKSISIIQNLSSYKYVVFDKSREYESFEYEYLCLLLKKSL